MMKNKLTKINEKFVVLKLNSFYAHLHVRFLSRYMRRFSEVKYLCEKNGKKCIYVVKRYFMT